MGSVFSPYYRRAWRAGRARADEHCAINVCLYSPGAGRWAMTERGSRHVERGARHFRVGPSALHWDGDGLQIDIDEVANPLPRRVRGRVRVRPQALSGFVAPLDSAGRHRWGPIAPCARAEVSFSEPDLQWQGHAYLDSNEGEEPISEPFTTWDWMRAPLPDGSSVVVYDIRQRGVSGERHIAARFWPDGRTGTVALPPRRGVSGTGWRVARHVRSEGPASVLATFEDTPFYARSLVQAELAGHTVQAMHETLSATRFASPWVQALLPWRMPRRG